MGCSNTKPLTVSSVVSSLSSNIPSELTHPILQIVYQIWPVSFIFLHGTYIVKHYSKSDFIPIKNNFEAYPFSSPSEKSQVAQCFLALFQKKHTLTIWGYWLDNIQDLGKPPVDIELLKESACHCLMRAESTPIESYIWLRIMKHPAYAPYLNSEEYTFGSRTMMQAMIRFYKHLSPGLQDIWSQHYPEFMTHLQHRQLYDAACQESVERETTHQITKNNKTRSVQVVESIPRWKFHAILIYTNMKGKDEDEIKLIWEDRKIKFPNYVVQSLIGQYLIQSYVQEWAPATPRIVKFLLSQITDFDREPFDWYSKQGTLQSLLISAIRLPERCQVLVILFSHPTYCRVIKYHQTDSKIKSVVQRIASVWLMISYVKKDIHLDLCRILYRHSPIEYRTYLNEIIPFIDLDVNN